ncbi:MAG: hypothetical protein WCK91_02190 [bacterium]
MEKSNHYFKTILSLLFFGLFFGSVSASDISSTHFIISDPVIGTSGGYQSSGSFKMFGTGNSLFSALGSSVSFISDYGFLYFPFINSGVLGGSVNSSDVNLSWTASTAGLGFNVSGYKIGRSLTSGSGYTFNSVGNTLNVIYASQPAGTYYFIVQTLDGLGSVAATSNEVVLTVSSTVVPPTQTGGAGGAGVPISTGAIFSGRAYPGSKVFLSKDGQLAASTVAGGDANFTISLTGLSSGDYLFLVYAEDQAGRRSTTFTFPVTLTSGATSNIGGIFIAPTIATDKDEVKQGDNLTIIGQAVPNGQVSISVHSSPELFVKTTSDKYGGYVYNFDTSVLDMGDHLTKSKASLSDAPIISAYGRAIGFKVGDKNVYSQNPVSTPETPVVVNPTCGVKADLNNDCRVNLFDYSILAYWYQKPQVSSKVDLNHDGKVDLIDFSIMAYYWTI